MARELKTIEVEPGSELDRLLDETNPASLRLVRGGKRFPVKIEEDAPDLWADDEAAPAGETILAVAGFPRDAGYEPSKGGPSVLDDADRRPSPEQVARSIAGIRRAAGAWAGNVDAEAFKVYVRERRRTANRPPVRWPE